MNLFAIIDLIQRRINSIIFRFIMIGYSILIICLYDNLVSSYIYLTGIILYFILYVFLTAKDLLRLLNDFVFVIFILIGKNPDETFLFVFLILPIINSINFSGTKRSWLLYLITVVAYYSLLCFYYNKIEVEILSQNYFPIISIIFLFFIEAYTAVRVKFRDFIEKLNAVVDSFYTNKDFFKKPHKLYPELIKLINEKIKKDLIENIYCFTIIPDATNKLLIVNTSNFVWNFKIDEKTLLKNFEKKDSFQNVELKTDDKESYFNYVLKVVVESTTYIYVITTKEHIPFYYNLIGFLKILKPVFQKISIVLLSEKRLQELNLDELQKLSQQSLYVARATKTMHHIRNRLGPINNLITMLEKQHTIDAEKQDGFKQLLKKETDRARIELKKIEERATYLLEKSNNPFNFTEMESVNIKTVFSIFSRSVKTHFPENEVSINISPEYINEDYDIEINKDGFDLFLIDWLCNIEKYKKSTLIFSFVIQDGKLQIAFWNDYYNTEDEVNKLISDMMSDDRNEIMKRKTHGLSQIKSCLEDMNIDYMVTKETDNNKNFIKFVINFKLIKYEKDSNI